MFKKTIIPNDKVSSSITLYESNDKVIDCIATTPGAIGFAQYSDRNDVKILLLEQNDNPLLFNENNINNYYPLYRKLFLIYNSEANVQTVKFIEWLFKPENITFYNKVSLLPPNMSQIIRDLEVYSDKFYR